MLKRVAVTFVVVLLGYGALYSLIEHARTRKGPWQVTFRSDVAGVPKIVINQPRLGITNVAVVFSKDELTAADVHDTIAFDRAWPVPYDLPFGHCVFLDTTSMPGSATLELLGHQIELLPRVLLINGREHPWQSGETIALPPAQTKKAKKD